MADIQKLAHVILKAIKENDVRNGEDLFRVLSYDPYIISIKNDDPNLVSETQGVLEFLITDGYIDGTIGPSYTKDRTPYSICGITQIGIDALG